MEAHEGRGHEMDFDGSFSIPIGGSRQIEAKFRGRMNTDSRKVALAGIRGLFGFGVLSVVVGGCTVMVLSSQRHPDAELARAEDERGRLAEAA